MYLYLQQFFPRHLKKNHNCNEKYRKATINSYEIKDSQDKHGAHQTTEIFPEVVRKMLEVTRRAYWFYSDHHTSSYGD